MARIELQDVSKVYTGGVRAVNALSLDIPDGDFMVFVGPSGCGKSTALRMVAGLEDITEGEIRIGDRVVNDMPPKDRDIAMVFQNYALYPHMTVEDNLAFGLQLRKTPKDEQKKRVAEAAKMLALEPFLKRKPAALSGGQRQRVAMGRAIVRNPQAYLMDEPLSNLDAKLRVSMRAQLASLHERLGVTTIYVTHDQIEAMTLGTRVAVLKDGELMQVDTPQMLFDAPDNLFVATFIGSPAMNLVEAKLVKDEGPALVFADHKVPLPAELVRHPRGPGGLCRQAADRRAAPQLVGGCGLCAGRLAPDQGRGRGDRGAGVGGQCDLPDGRPPGPSRCDDRQVRQGGQRRGRSGRGGRRGPVAVDGQGQPQDPGQDRPQHRHGRRHLRVPLLRRRHRPGHRPRHRGRRRPRTTGSEVRPGVTRVAFLGLGRMGAPMAGRLSNAGHDLVVWSRTRAHAEALADRAEVAGSPAEAGSKADVAVTMLADGAALEEVVLGRDGLAGGLGSGSLLIDMSTTGPAPARKVAKALEERGVGFVDAPVAGSVGPASEGTLAIMVGGPDEAVERARPLLEVLGDPRRTWHVGPVGAGQAAKLMVNLVLGGVTVAVAEGYTLGRVLGLSPDDALDVLEGASVATQTVRSKRDMLRSGDYGDPGFRLALMHKDLRLAVDAARAARASLPGTERVAELYAGAKGRGLADQDYAAVAAYLASMAPLLEHTPPES